MESYHLVMDLCRALFEIVDDSSSQDSESISRPSFSPITSLESHTPSVSDPESCSAASDTHTGTQVCVAYYGVIKVSEEERQTRANNTQLMPLCDDFTSHHHGFKGTT